MVTIGVNDNIIDVMKGQEVRIMGKVISIGNQGFESLRQSDFFYIDKTAFIKEWWESGDEITLIARPRRFGKTLNMNMLNCFFSEKYAGRSDLFEGLSIWKEASYRALQGTYPVIFLSFASVKGDNFIDTRNQIIDALNEAYKVHYDLLQSESLTEGERAVFQQLDCYTKDASVQKQISNDIVCSALRTLSGCLQKIYGKKAIILLDEYDTPMQEAYVYGYWEEFTAFIRSLFNATFKTNPYLERAVMTEITRVSKESIFSDLNNLNVVTTTSNEYETCFGFTEKEVFDALAQNGMAEQKEVVKQWYDGFTFGKYRDIYNPWSITNFLDKKQLRPYWAATSSNGLINKLLQSASAEIKEKMEQLLQGEEIVVNFDEQIVFEQLNQDENAIWSLLLASGYLKVEEIEYRGILLEPWYHLSITNLETMSMFSTMFKGWFHVTQSSYNRFMKALLQGDVEAMNHYMNEVALATFSYFDTGKGISDKGEPERFYHGFVLGLMVDLRESYEIRSNRESGFGRYDILMIPREKENFQTPAIVLEFKVHNPKKENSLEDTVRSALQQIDLKRYDEELLDAGIASENIRHYGFAFKGKQVLIG